VKNYLAKKIFGRVSIAHGIVILLTILLPLFRGCSPKPKDIVTFVDLSGGPAPAQVYEPEPEAASEPEIKSKIEPKPEPKPEKKLLPKKVETNAPPKKVESKKPAVTNAPARPKTEAEKLAAIRQDSKRVRNPNAKTSAPARPAIDYSGLRNALNSAATGSGSGRGGTSSGSGSGSGGGMYSPFAGYYDSVKQQMYDVWQQPAGAPIGTTATATVRVERDGTVSLKSITSRSGNVPFDQSVQSALNVTVRLPIPPADLPNPIEIEFKLSD